MFAYLDILRPHNAAMSVLAVFIGWILISDQLLAPQLIFSLIAVFLIFGAGNAINDYVDVESDKINKPKRPIPSGRMGKNAALLYSIILFAAGIFMAWSVNTVAFIIAVLNTAILVIYSTMLQNKVFLGNMSIAYLTGSTFLFGGAATGSMDFLRLPLILGLLSGLATLSREIIKDLEDIEGDKQSFLKRLSKGVGRLAERFGFHRSGEIELKYNKERAKAVAALSLLASVLISPVPFLTGLFGPVYIIALLPVDCVFLFAFYSILKSGKRSYSSISKNIKIGMMLALVAFVLGILF